MRKIIVQIATSADGYIARPDGAVEWLDRPHPPGDYGMAEFFSTIDSILWGRKTYDMALTMGGLGMFGPTVKNYIFTTNPPAADPKDAVFVRQAIPDFLKEVRELPGKDIWMMGGAGLIASFLDLGAIDEFSIHVIPVMIGEGIPLVAPRHRNVQLDLIGTKQFEDGVVHLNYRVRR